MESSPGPIHFLNVEYFFRLLYDLVTGARVGGVQIDFLSLASQIWILVTIISTLVTIGILAVFIHSSLRYYQVLRGQAHKFTTLDAAHAETERDHSRWDHIRELIESPHENDWRQAIIEADIMLDDLLSQLGYPGETVGEKLKAVDPKRMNTLQDAWEGHKVRNEIAHQGYAYQLTERHAHRTIAHFEAVMREFGEI
ncbi:hypothetical protein KJ819_03870 [Patescibacteria group bacterium]|nr:hypothetical protein [Patescibacteria group bacterium]MBU1500495.1 hypothetical protein [Patescibacteria group bacterium]MBU2080706.1 hypothetical protein [Patescibacteria group bacterium]MBU2123811.1 hypothetical protein [Patescibacteria group bacterium]MBU2194898.1 hypothetical protein [Patescibacteria group bacterium]